MIKLPLFNSSGSSPHLSLLLFGGRLKITVQEPELNPDGSIYTFKSRKRKGEIKLVKKTKYAIIKGLGFQPKKETEMQRMNKASGKKEPIGIYETNETVLRELLERCKEENKHEKAINPDDVPW